MVRNPRAGNHIVPDLVGSFALPCAAVRSADVLTHDDKSSKGDGADDRCVAFEVITTQERAKLREACSGMMVAIHLVNIAPIDTWGHEV